MINLRQYVVSAIELHLAISGERKTAFTKRIGMNHSNMNCFLSGGCDISLTKADDILKAIQNYKPNNTMI